MDYREVLSPEQFAAFVKLRTLRQAISKEDGCRVYPSHVSLNRRSRVRFRRKLRWLEREHATGRLDEISLQQRLTALVAFTRAGSTASWRWRSRALQSLAVDGQGLEPGHPGR